AADRAPRPSGRRWARPPARRCRPPRIAERERRQNMRIVAASEVQATLDFPALVDRLRDAFRRDVTAPVRHHHTIERSDEADATLLLMPAWQSGRHVGIKIVTVTPGNAER